jgi:hypothetical protein
MEGELMQAICRGCQKVIDVPDLPEPQIVNLPNMSMVIVEHTRRGVCPHCALQVSAGICGVAKLAVMAIPMQEEPDKKVIVPVMQMPKSLRTH